MEDRFDHDPVPTRLIGAVLTGGLSSRMGQPKALLPHSTGGSFLSHAIRRMRQVTGEKVLLSLPKDDDQLPLSDGLLSSSSIIRVPDTLPNQGPAVGVWRCLLRAQVRGHSACLLTPVDLPELTATDLQELVQVWQNDPEQIVVANDETEERLQPLVAIYPTRCLPAIEGVVKSHHRSLYRHLQTQSFLRVDLPRASLRNVNSPDDLSSEPS
ncbi:molybdenum cofactor guanylyltransferase [Rhodopirellula sp. JC740]|uniref:Molybdenum cofactor guanylyltransferase n=1 Tax=Rhodopirellula halodulae TaxID=2894198 RepID=A0ABS8NC47_9BACT|nr:molybdenum cofactor guanylyltransferase [Rhodopirellula sp. JC740]MCC9641142.1 molybdenum cofactor guanylyltransferase [Rhodopirellula sp. JC740]